uniref:Protein transport Sec1a-like n=1 Tax=Nelumbo nucifera TaxID=4432 RepID=A0A822XME6_NELNU|nr:TPA_asm: hypothetical protein HUJ06_020161 [Nelumbo nucifera]
MALSMLPSLNPSKNSFTAQHMKSLSKCFKKYGLRYDDLYDPMYDLDIRKAMARLPCETVDATNQRLKDAVDLLVKHKYLPDDLQAMKTSFRKYLQDVGSCKEDRLIDRRGGWLVSKLESCPCRTLISRLMASTKPSSKLAATDYCMKCFGHLKLEIQNQVGSLSDVVSPLVSWLEFTMFSMILAVVEDLFRRRQPLPSMDAIYFIQPTKENFLNSFRPIEIRNEAYDHLHDCKPRISGINSRAAIFVREKDGNIFWAFSGPIGTTNSTKSDALAALKVIRIAKDLGFTRIAVEGDTANTIKCIVMFLSDMSGRVPLYKKAFVFFSSPTPKELVTHIKNDTSVLPRIGALKEFNLEYFPIDSQVVLEVLKKLQWAPVGHMWLGVERFLFLCNEFSSIVGDGDNEFTEEDYRQMICLPEGKGSSDWLRFSEDLQKYLCFSASDSSREKMLNVFMEADRLATTEESTEPNRGVVTASDDQNKQGSFIIASSHNTPKSVVGNGKQCLGEEIRCYCRGERDEVVEDYSAKSVAGLVLFEKWKMSCNEKEFTEASTTVKLIGFPFNLWKGDSIDRIVSALGDLWKIMDDGGRFATKGEVALWDGYPKVEEDDKLTWWFTRSRKEEEGVGSGEEESVSKVERSNALLREKNLMKKEIFLNLTREANRRAVLPKGIEDVGEREEDLKGFITDNEKALEQLFGEDVENSQIYDACLNTMAMRIATMFASLREFPFVRYRASKSLDASTVTSFRELVPTKLAALVWNYLSKYKTTIPNFPQAETCELIILDRSVDQIAPVIHEWTYDAMCHDLLEMEGNKYVHEVPSKTGGAPEKKEVLLEDHDPIWLELRHAHIADASERLHDKMTNFISKNKAAQIQHGSRDGSELSTRDLQKMVQALPQYTEQMDKLSLHVEIAGKINRLIRELGLRDLGQLEQDLVFGDAGAKEVINFLRTNQDATPENKLRLLMIYSIVYPEKFEADKGVKLMQLAKLSPDDMKAVNNMRLLERQSDAKKASMGGFSLKFDAQKKKNAARKDRTGEEEAWQLSRFYPMIEEIIEKLSKGDLSKDDYSCMNDPSPTVHGGTRGASVRTTQIPAAHSIRSRRTATWARPRHSDDGCSSDSVLKNALNDFKNMGQRIFVFIIGGATRSELRVCHKLTTKLKREVILGSSSIDDPPQFISKLKMLTTKELSVDDIRI